MNIEQTILTKVTQEFTPESVGVINESYMHAGPAENSHFNLTVVSDHFEGKRPVARHQMVYKILAEELAGEVHALALHLYTPVEWAEAGQNSQVSPNCHGGH